MIKRIKDTIGRLFPQGSDPVRYIEDIHREINRVIPEMNETIGRLREEKFSLREEVRRLNAEREKLFARRDIAEKTRDSGLLETVKEMMETNESLLTDGEDRYAAIEHSYEEALGAMKDYIEKRKNQLNRALLKADENSRSGLRKELDEVLDRFTLNLNEEKCPGDLQRNDNARAKEGDDKLTLLRSLILEVRKEDARKKVGEIITIAEKIMDDIRRRPGDINRARLFITYYLNAVINIIQKYNDLAGNETRSDNIRQTISRTEEYFTTILDAFRSLHDKFYENDIINIEAEIRVLESTFKMNDLI